MAVLTESEIGVSATDASSRVKPRHSVANTYLNQNSLAFKARQRRFRFVRQMIEDVIAEKGSCRIADIGGTEYYWQISDGFLDQSPVEITLINLEAPPTKGDRFQSIAGDATDLSDIDDNAFDLVHSNSVIEHVGNWDQMSKMAANVRRLAPSYYVQTPNFWFPYEPHFRCPFFQYLPEQVRAKLLMTFNLGFGGRRETLDAAMRAVQSAVLLDGKQMQVLFPDAEMKRERIAFFTKSLMMMKTLKGRDSRGATVATSYADSERSGRKTLGAQVSESAVQPGCCRACVGCCQST